MGKHESIVADGETGLHLALTEPYDAAIIDIMLPKLYGLSLIDQSAGLLRGRRTTQGDDLQ